MSASAAQQRILFGMGKWAAAGVDRPELDLVMILSGYANKKEGFKKNLSQMKKLGLIAFPSKDTMALTPKGEGLVGRDAQATTNEEMQDFIRRELLQPSGIRVFDEILDGRAHSRESVSVATDYVGKPEGFKKTLSIMKKMKVLEYVGKTHVKLTNLAFPRGRPGEEVRLID